MNCGLCPGHDRGRYPGRRGGHPFAGHAAGPAETDGPRCGAAVS